MAVHLVRHASAGSRNDRDPRDAERHLDERGLRQAVALVGLLVDRDVVWVASSTADRCLETVAPLAEERGLPVVATHALFEGSEPDDAWHLLTVAAAMEGDAVLCSHGDVIPDLIRRAQFRGMEIPGRSGCAKGSCWTLSGWDGTGFARGDYVPNPV